MAFEYFSTLQYIWLYIVFFIFSLFLFAVCLYSFLFVRWVYKRRLRQKADEMIDAYKSEEEKRKEMELNIKRKELKLASERRKKTLQKPRKIHIVTTPCKKEDKTKPGDFIVRQINEQIAKVEAIQDRRTQTVQAVQPQPPPIQQLSMQQAQNSSRHPIASVEQPPQQPQQQLLQKVQLASPQLPQQPLAQLQVPSQQSQPQYIMVPVEIWNNRVNICHARHHPEESSTTSTPSESSHRTESVGTQTSDRLIEVVNNAERNSVDWLSGYDLRDGPQTPVDEEIESVSDKVMRRRAAWDAKQKALSLAKPAVPVDGSSEETRVDMDGLAPMITSGTSTTTTTQSLTPPSQTDSSDSTSSGRSSVMVPISTLPISPDNSEKITDKTMSSIPLQKSAYIKPPGSKKLSAESMQPPAKLSSHTSAFPYFVDSKASEQTTSPPDDDPKKFARSPLALYKNKSRRGSSEKIYSPEAKSKKKDAKFS
uniref:Uncharacterized protein n=1 Tax=Caenorhabditis japonica TaxID=281687 RepID=A0A8R1E0U9_CAEJA